MDAVADELVDYDPIPVVDVSTVDLIMDVAEVEAAEHININAIKAFVGRGLVRILNAFKSDILANNLIDDRFWEISFVGDKIFVYNIHLYVRDGISLAFSNSDGIIFTADNYRNTSVSTKCFNLIAPVDKFDKFVTGDDAQYIGHDVPLSGMPLSQLSDLADENKEYKFELNDELNQRLADFFTIIFGMSYRASLTIISYSNILLTDDCVVIENIEYNERYVRLLESADIESFGAAIDCVGQDVDMCSLRIPCAWIDEIAY